MPFVIKNSTRSPSPISGNWVSIDPGLGGTGWATWDYTGLCSSGSISIRKGSWESRARWIADTVQYNFTEAKVCFYELPFIAFRGKAAISAQQQDVIKLTMLAGMISRCFERPYAVPVIKWKGQLPKHLVKERVMKYLNTIHYSLEGKTSHEIDAIGIGLYVIKMKGIIP